MTLAGVQPQVWMSIVGIVVAAAIALIMDIMRRKNEELRQALADLQAIRLQDHTRVAVAPHAPAVVPVPPPAPIKTAVETAIPLPEQDEDAGRKAANTALTEWLNKRSHKASEPQPSEPEPSEPETSQPEPVATTAAKQLAELFDMEPEQAAAELEQALSEPVPAEAVAEAPAEPLAEAAVETVAETPCTEVASEPAPSGPQVFIDEALLAAIFGPSEAAPKSNLTPRFELIEGAGGIPAGMHEPETLARLVDANKPFTGLAFALCVTNKDGRAAGPTESASMYHFVRGQLRKADFGCQTGPGEFLLLLPEQGSTRRNEIMEQLWDYQLRGMGNFSVLFSWGDALVTAEPLAEAIDSASERMRQTLRSRKSVSLELASPFHRSAAAKAAVM